MKRFSLVVGLALALTLVFAASAFANFGPHGGYIADTDACAGCHRAHSSFSTIRYVPSSWDNNLLGNPTEADKRSALLVGSATTMTEFCNACHGDLAPGASTNVVMGLFDGGPSAATNLAVPGANDGVVTSYQTSSTALAPLNGGGFAKAANLVDWEAGGAAAYKNITSAHSMEKVGVLWGAGSAANQTMTLNCTSCHDPHGSSNYRLLKDAVNSVPVGGYNADGSPKGMVFSTEKGYDTVFADDGWLKQQAGQDQMTDYRPNYTSGSSQIMAGTKGFSLSTWCAACHTQYDQSAGTHADPIAGTSDYGAYEASSTALVTAKVRHRHPVDMSLRAGDANLQVKAQNVASISALDRKIPLEVNPNADTSDITAVRGQYNVGCLTCHYAHGGSAVMSGWSAAHLELIGTTWAPVRDLVAGVNPAKADVVAGLGTPPQAGVTGSSALLRADQRGVCERCHNK